MPLPDLLESGDLPAGIHAAKLNEVVHRFGGPGLQRRILADRLQRIHAIAAVSGHLARFVVFGSFVTSKQSPNDVDIFMVMDGGFDASQLEGEAAVLFDHLKAQS